MINWCIIGGSLFAGIFEAAIDFKQILSLINLKPTAFSRLIIKDDVSFEKMRKYNMDRLVFGTLTKIINLILLMIYVLTNVYLLGYFKVLYLLPENLQTAYFPQVFSIFLMCLWSIIENLPFDVISVFWIEQKHGFNKTTLSTFFSDKIKGLLVTGVIVCPISYICLLIIDHFPNSFYLQLFTAVLICQLVVVVLFPIVIQPLFNKFSDLEEGELKSKICDLANKIKFNASRILVMDGSKRSHHSNAYFIGLFKEKRIVLFDTLLKQANNNEILAILCHEFGHWYYSHTMKQIIVASIQMFGLIYIFNIFSKNDAIFLNLLESSGYKDSEVPMAIKILYFNLCMNFISPLQTFLVNCITRAYERSADRYAVRLGFGQELKNGLVKIHVENKSNILPDKLYSAFHHSHPTLLERIDLINREMQLKID